MGLTFCGSDFVPLFTFFAFTRAHNYNEYSTDCLVAWSGFVLFGLAIEYFGKKNHRKQESILSSTVNDTSDISEAPATVAEVSDAAEWTLFFLAEGSKIILQLAFEIAIGMAKP